MSILNNDIIISTVYSLEAPKAYIGKDFASLQAKPKNFSNKQISQAVASCLNDFQILYTNKVISTSEYAHRLSALEKGWQSHQQRIVNAITRSFLYRILAFVSPRFVRYLGGAHYFIPQHITIIQQSIQQTLASLRAEEQKPPSPSYHEYELGNFISRPLLAYTPEAARTKREAFHELFKFTAEYPGVPILIREGRPVSQERTSTDLDMKITLDAVIKMAQEKCKTQNLALLYFQSSNLWNLFDRNANIVVG